MVYTSTYMFILCTYSVHAAMYFVHNHTSLQIRSYLPCDASESQLRAGSAPAEQYPSCQQSPPLTDHPGAASHVQTATATDCALSLRKWKSCSYVSNRLVNAASAWTSNDCSHSCPPKKSAMGCMYPSITTHHPYGARRIILESS